MDYQYPPPTQGAISGVLLVPFFLPVWSIQKRQSSIMCDEWRRMWWMAIWHQQTLKADARIGPQGPYCSKKQECLEPVCYLTSCVWLWFWRAVLLNVRSYHYTTSSWSKQRKKDLENIFNWLRNKGKKDNNNGPTGDFRKAWAYDSQDEVSRHTPNYRAHDIEGGFLDYWMCSNRVSLHDNDDMEQFHVVSLVPVPHCTPGERAKDIEGTF